jgi:hypothetical protein
MCVLDLVMESGAMCEGPSVAKLAWTVLGHLARMAYSYEQDN